ncbi:MAG: hypothetical protein M0Q53_14220 [Prolixibacteraceae bacterium]|jgi:hypothetical protein|nr:hypothetical protein [Prolixibacteraceae bacterium]
MKTKFTIASMLFVFLLAGHLDVFAQKEVTVIDSTADGTIKFARINAQAKAGKNEEPKALLKRILKAGSGTQFYLYKVVTDKLGLTHEKYQQPLTV